MGGRIGRRLTALAALALLLAGCGRVPTSVALDTPEPAPAIPAACLGAGLDLALASGAYAVPLAGESVSAQALPAWESAPLQTAPASPSPGDGPVTLCAYVADHPTPFSARGGDDAVVCVLVDQSDEASLLGARTVASGGEAAACSATDR